MNFFYNYINAKYLSSKDSANLELQIFLSLMIIVAGLSCATLSIYFFYAGITFFVIISTIAALTYVIAFLLNKAGNTRAASIIFVCTITILSLLAIHYFGTDVNAQCLIILALLPTVLYFDFTKVQKVCLVSALPILVNIEMLMPTSPSYLLVDSIFLNYYYANSTMVGILIILTANEIISRKLDELRKKDIAAFKEMSYVDPLTRLSNRRYADIFFNELENSNLEYPPVFCLMDIDNFKVVNDTYGHDIGDVVIQFIADILRQNARQTDLACRWGGEEFLVVLCNCSFESGQAILKKICYTIESEEIKTDAGNIKVTITGGAIPLTEGGIKSTLEDCDKKLYEGKQSGKRRIVI